MRARNKPGNITIALHHRRDLIRRFRVRGRNVEPMHEHLSDQTRNKGEINSRLRKLSRGNVRNNFFFFFRIDKIDFF